jgi:hypothetical protein
MQPESETEKYFKRRNTIIKWVIGIFIVLVVCGCLVGLIIVLFFGGSIATLFYAITHATISTPVPFITTPPYVITCCPTCCN